MADEKQASKYIKMTLDMIANEINHILTSSDINPEFYEKYTGFVEVCDEQIFAKKKNLNPSHIYIVVKFGTASFDFGQALLPITINAVSEQNAIEICQGLLFDLAINYTQQAPIEGTEIPEEDDYVKQIWNTPNVINNFNEVNTGFRSLFYMTGVVLIGHHSSPIVELVYNKGEVSEFKLHEYMINFSDSFDVYPDTQAFYSTNGIGRTAAKTASYGFSVTLFKVDDTNGFMRKIRNIKRGNVDPQTGEPSGISTKFNFFMRDKDEDEETGGFRADYILVNMTVQQNKGDLPTVALTFAR